MAETNKQRFERNRREQLPERPRYREQLRAQLEQTYERDRDQAATIRQRMPERGIATVSVSMGEVTIFGE